jgi:N-acetylmuramoyl-L-alanine amidase
MKFGIDMGHNCPPHDTGASGIKQEDVLTKDVGTLLMAKLSAAGHSVINCTPSSATSLNNSLQQRVNKANSNSVDIFVSIHFNAFKKTDKPMGSEIYAISNASQAIARSVLAKIVELGFKNRGVKNTAFFVIKNTSMPAILIECCFVDSKTDMDLFDAEKMAEAIKVGLIGEDSNSSTPEPATIRITKPTILKPSTLQSKDIPPSELADIAVGDYSVLDISLEERHFWVKWPDKSEADRDEHFIFEEHAEIIDD